MFTLQGDYQTVIGLLRFLIFPDGVGVLDRRWEVRGVWGGIAYPYKVDSGPEVGHIFPEFRDEAPFEIDGIRLVERMALASHELEIQVVRLADDNIHDLLIAYEPLVVETSDEQLFIKIKDFIDSTNGPQSRACFW